MNKIILSIILMVGIANADLNINIKEQCQKIIDTKGKYELPVNSYINGVVTGILTAVDKRYHRSQIVGKRDKIILLGCKEAFARENPRFESSFVKGVQVHVDRRLSRFRKLNNKIEGL